MRRRVYLTASVTFVVMAGCTEPGDKDPCPKPVRNWESVMLDEPAMREMIRTYPPPGSVMDRCLTCPRVPVGIDVRSGLPVYAEFLCDDDAIRRNRFALTYGWLGGADAWGICCAAGGCFVEAGANPSGLAACLPTEAMDYCTSGTGFCSQCDWTSIVHRCTLCGNGQLDYAETCDVGDATPGDGCSATCRIE